MEDKWKSRMFHVLRKFKVHLFGLLCIGVVVLILMNSRKEPRYGLRNAKNMMTVYSSRIFDEVISQEKHCERHQRMVDLDTDQTNKTYCDIIAPKYAFTQSLNVTHGSQICKTLPFIKNMKNPCFYDDDLRLRCLPYFFIFSPQKSGTNELYFSLTEHPQVVNAKGEGKEHDWFNRRRLGLYKNVYPRAPLSEYMDEMSYYFETRAQQSCTKIETLILGDGTASTFWDNLLWKHEPDNYGLNEPFYLVSHFMKHLVPNAKFIALLRNPTERLWSDYTYYSKRGEREASPGDFHNKVLSAVSWMVTCLQNKTRTDRSCLYDIPGPESELLTGHPDISWNPVIRLRIGMYVEYLRDWFEVYSREQFFIRPLSVYAKNKVQVLQEISIFLGLQNHTFSSIDPDAKKYTNARSDIGMTNETRTLLDTFYMPYNRALKHLLEEQPMIYTGSTLF